MSQRAERDYADYDSYLRDQGYCPVHMVCADVRHPCLLCEMEKEEKEERYAAIAPHEIARDCCRTCGARIPLHMTGDVCSEACFNETPERDAAIAKDDYYNSDGYAVWEDKR